VREYGGPELWQGHAFPAYSDDLGIHCRVGCPACNQTGYAGRMGLHELLMGTDECKRLIEKSSPTEAIRAQAIKDGMHTLKQDGIGKILGGFFDLMQVRKVCIK
jgi:type II secretory ATPase GspE/PulE/Tfp pilus assembly ATPase PilB-like protein